MYFNQSNTDIEDLMDLRSDQGKDTSSVPSLPTTFLSSNLSFELSPENPAWNSDIFDDIFLNEQCSKTSPLGSKSVDPIDKLLSSDFSLIDSPPDSMLTQQNENHFENTTDSFSSSNSTENIQPLPKYTKFGKKKVLKHSDEYYDRRFKNNIAVKKAREKAKEKEKIRQLKTEMLVDENQRLISRIDRVEEELQSIRRLFEGIR